MVIVSLTTTSKRLELLRISLLSLLHQNSKPDRIWVWVSKEAYLSDAGIESVEWLEDKFSDVLSSSEVPIDFKMTENTGPYRKLLPTLELCETDDLIVTADDDIFYGKQWLTLLLNSYHKNQGFPLAGRARKVMRTPWGAIKGYMTWPLVTTFGSETEDSLLTFGGGAVLKKAFFPPNFVRNEEYKNLAPTADDIWYTHALFYHNQKVFVEPRISQELYFIRHPLGLLEEYNHSKSFSALGIGFLARTINWSKRELGIASSVNDRCYRNVGDYFHSKKDVLN